MPGVRSSTVPGAESSLIGEAVREAVDLPRIRPGGPKTERHGTAPEGGNGDAESFERESNTFASGRRRPDR